MNCWLFMLLFIPKLASAYVYNGAPCNTYEECLFGLGSAVVLAAQVSEAAKIAFEQNWKVIIDHQRLRLAEKFRTQAIGCHLKNDLLYAPPESPLGASLRSQIEGINRIAGGVNSRTDEYLFEKDATPIRQMASNKMSFGLLNERANTPEKARQLLDLQRQWENSQDQAMFEKNRLEYVAKFEKSCDHSLEHEIKATREKLLSQNKEFWGLEQKFQKIQQECQALFEFNLRRNNRYQKNGLARRRFELMKRAALILCSPLDAFFFISGNEANDCSHYVSDVYSIVSPECEDRKGQESKANACNGLHRYLKEVFLNNPSYDTYLRSFILKMKEASNDGKAVDLLQLATEATNGDMAAAVRLIALVGHDEINTTMNSIREELIKTRQYERATQTADLFTNETHAFEADDKRYGKDQVTYGNTTLFKDLIRSGSTIGGNKISGRYYHFVAGMTVACELRQKGYGTLRSRNAAANAGVVYETYDFISHMRQGVGLRSSIDNFSRDTAKHEAGGRLGSEICQ